MIEEDTIRKIIAKYQNEEYGDDPETAAPTAMQEIIKALTTQEKVTKVFYTQGAALTLNVEEVTDKENCTGGTHTRSHPDRWTITGRICEDMRTWVNEFEAVHPLFGRVWGNFEEEVHADSEEGFQHFYANHKPEEWDYADV